MYLTQTSAHTGISDGLDNANAPSFRLTTFGAAAQDSNLCYLPTPEVLIE